MAISNFPNYVASTKDLSKLSYLADAQIYCNFFGGEMENKIYFMILCIKQSIYEMKHIYATLIELNLEFIFWDKHLLGNIR